MTHRAKPHVRLAVIVIMSVVSVLAAASVSTRLRLDPNVAALLPDRGDSAALRQYLEAFGGSDLSMVLVRARPDATGDSVSEEVRIAAHELASALQRLDAIRTAAAGLSISESLDPMLAWRHADGPARR